MNNHLHLPTSPNDFIIDLLTIAFQATHLPILPSKQKTTLSPLFMVSNVAPQLFSLVRVRSCFEKATPCLRLGG